ncbi:MAG: glycerophosphodiester phosphodiesterase family protein [Phycisphaerales bacterium JB065]
MLKSFIAIALTMSAVVTAGLEASKPETQSTDFIIVAHRGASGYLPEHTLAAYAMAYAMGADMIEPDVVLTRDNIPICLHDLTLNATTNAREVFPDRGRDDGKWYAIDFDLAELKTLEKHGRNSTDTGYRIVTLDEMLTLIDRLNAKTKHTVGVVPEIKQPQFHSAEGYDLAAVTIQTLASHGYTDRDDPVILQCFDATTLHRIRHELNSDLPLMFLTGKSVDMDTLRSVSRWCDAAGINHKHIDPALGGDPSIAREAQSCGLKVISYTLKNNPDEIRQLIDIGIDGIFADYPDIAIRARRP